MAAKYDPEVVQSYADRLYSKASEIIVTTCIGWGILGGLLGCLGSLFIDAMVQHQAHGQPIDPSGSSNLEITVIVGGLVAGLLLGYDKGRSKSFALRLEAQNSLCLLQIEKNTRTV